MASYQVVCSVVRPPPPTQQCQITDFQEKVQQHIGSVFHDAHIENSSRESISLQGQEEAAGEREREDPLSGGVENQILCALISKTKASFSGEDNFQSKVRLPYFWCNFCPFGTESRPSLLQHLTSQHCFCCHYCPFVAFTRSVVARHSLRQHPEFERKVREQKLKECHLWRNIFQKRFAPSTLPDATAKGAAGRDVRSTVGLGAQGIQGDTGSQDDGADVASAIDAGFDSSSDSSDAHSLSGHRSEGQGTDHNSSAADCNSWHRSRPVSKAKSLGENIVSSSSMDMEAAGDFCVYPEPGTEFESEFLQGREYTETEHGHWLKRDGKEQQTVTVKQEVESEEGFSFALQGGQDRCGMEEDAGSHLDMSEHKNLHQTSAAIGQSMEQCEPSSAQGRSQHCVFPVGQPVVVKTELESDEGFRTNTWEDRGPSVQDRSSSSYGVRSTPPASPPLSSIRVENLQRQFEESVRNTNLGLHVTEHNVHPPPGCLEPDPRVTVQDQAECSGQICSRQAQGQNVVDNFLLAPSTTTHRTESLTLLRNLLTRCDTGVTENKASHSDVHVHSAFEPSVVRDNFLSDGHSVAESKLRGEGEQAGLDTGVQIKQEPEDDAVCTHLESSGDPHCDRSFSEKAHLSAEGSATVEHHLDTHNVSESENLRSHNSMSADPNLSLRDILNRSCPRSEASNNLTQISKQGESLRPDHRVLHTPSASGHWDSSDKIQLSAAEKLKALSHMTLRDILTMKVPLGLDLDSGSPSTSAVNVTEISMGDGDGRGQVVWECGFCDFSAVKKQEVMVHRKQWHGEYSLHPGTGSPYDTSADNACEDGVFLKAGHFDDCKQHWSGHGHRGGHHGSSVHHKANRKQGTSQSSQHATPSRKRTRGRGHKYNDYDYSYQSASPLSVDSSSDSEAEEDDPEDRNYVPPHYLLDKMDSTGSESESSRPKKMRSGTTRKFHHKGRRGRKGLRENTGFSDHLPSSKRAGKSGRTSKFLAYNTCQGNGFYNLSHKYVCPYCDHPPSSLRSMKNHIRFACSSDQQHRLIAEMTTYPYSVLFVCPSDSCFFVSSSEKVYLEHVLPCQGLILDAGEKFLFEQLRRNCEERPNKEGHNVFHCCVASCGYSSCDVDSLREHLRQHVNTFHASQMVLVDTVCTAMAELSDTPDFMCYLCTEWMSSMDEVGAHCEGKHDGRVRGVFHILRTEAETDMRPPGLLVSMICLHCKQQVPELESWFCHTCPATPGDGGDSGGTSQKPYRHAEPVCYPPLDAWPWRTAKASTDDDNAENRKQNQLPLVRSILLDKVGMISDQKNLSSRQEPSLVQILSTLGSSRVALPASRGPNQQETTKTVEQQGSHSGTAHKDKDNRVTQPSSHSQLAASASVGSSCNAGNSTEAALTMCGECQYCHQSVSDTQGKNHRCLVDKISKADEAEQEHPSGAHTAEGKTEGCKLGLKNTEADQQTCEESYNTSVKRSHRLLAKRLQSSTSKKAEKISCHTEDGGHDSPAGKRSSDSAGALESKNLTTLKSAKSGKHRSSVSDQDPASVSSAASTIGSPSLRSLLVGLPAGDGDALGKVVKQARGNTSLLRDRLLARSDSGPLPGTHSTLQQKSQVASSQRQLSQVASSQRQPGHSRQDDTRMPSSGMGRSSPRPNSSSGPATSALGAAQRVGSKGSGLQAEVDKPDSPGGAQLGMGESSYMVNWLHQQGSQMMRVLGGAMPKDEEY